MNIPVGAEAIDHQSQIVVVELQKCRDWLGYSYTANGWHYSGATIKQYILNPQLTYNDSILKIYYEKFQPKSLIEALFIKNNKITIPNDEQWPALPWLHVAYKPRNSNYQHFGPNPDHYGKTEFSKTIDLYKKLSKNGYQPKSHRDGFIRGYFLKHYDDYRFVVSGGQHRIAALAMLGYKNIEVKIQPSYQRVIDIQKVHKWINVRNNKYNQEEAIQIFNLYFNENGKNKAKKIGIYSKIYM
ncbi:hypothetical protein KP806_07765 [Paenibacillus sp. N4]|uniref:hypothetical protein n=1 Tax=Paenibacillus vietnamensis TaxID=2590547 RepID=UPI001CD0BEF1|nr:hypothetical protein [Paenibacillus vietnamensis]MCA0754944.1 hypothetical protein [Paenibacillus vietnamensis]